MVKARPSRTMGSPYLNTVVWSSHLFKKTFALSRGALLLLSSFLFILADNLHQLQPSIVVSRSSKITASKANTLFKKFAVAAFRKDSSYLTALLPRYNTQNGRLARPYGLEI